nr:NAD(P)-binding protein [Mammaliicoccus sp. Marseille-Q6498]
MAYIPLMVDLADKKIKVFGGGKIAEKRVATLLKSEAEIHVISPDVTDMLEKLHVDQKVIWHEKSFEISDIKDADFIIAATNEKHINDAIKEATPKGILLNMVGEANEGNVIFPGTFNRGKLSISVSSSGASPKLVSTILNDLQNEYPIDYESFVDFLYVCRNKIKNLDIQKSEKQALLEEIISEKYLDINEQQQFMEFLNSQGKKI